MIGILWLQFPPHLIPQIAYLPTYVDILLSEEKCSYLIEGCMIPDKANPAEALTKFFAKCNTSKVK